MPRAYEAMRDKFAEGAPVDSPKYDRAQARAAAIYNARHKGRPVTGRSDSTSVKAKAVGGKKRKRRTFRGHSSAEAAAALERRK